MNTLAFLPNLGWPEMLIIGVVMLLLFGRRLPEVGRSLGQGIVSFKRGLNEVQDEVRHDKGDTQGTKDAAPDRLEPGETTAPPGETTKQPSAAEPSGGA